MYLRTYVSHVSGTRGRGGRLPRKQVKNRQNEMSRKLFLHMEHVLYDFVFVFNRNAQC